MVLAVMFRLTAGAKARQVIHTKCARVGQHSMQCTTVLFGSVTTDRYLSEQFYFVGLISVEFLNNI